MAQIDKSLAPFTYTGSWDINEYSPGLFYARFLTSGTLTPKQPFTCDAFLVGGGGGGGGTGVQSDYSGYAHGGGGGGGGRTNSIYNIKVATSVSTTIGSGGGGGIGGDYESAGTQGSNGSETRFGTYSVSGGSGGNSGGTNSNPYDSRGKGGNGGSGGGGGTWRANTNSTNVAGNGGSNGSDGYSGGSSANKGIGQGGTTRPFNGSSPFSSMRFGGGGGGGNSGYGATADTAGTGGAGGGGNGTVSLSSAPAGSTNTGGGGGGGGGGRGSGGSGGSGIVIIRGVLNLAPTTPDGIAYGQPNAGKPLLLSTGGSTDPEGNAISYVWEHRTDSGVYTQIGVTVEPQITATVPTSGTTYQARVKAVDDKGAESGYTEGLPIPINYYQAFVGGLDSTPTPVSKIIIAGHEIKAGWVEINGQIKRIDSI